MTGIKRYFYNLLADGLDSCQVAGSTRTEKAPANEFVRSDTRLTRHYFLVPNPTSTTGRPFVSANLPDALRVGAGIIGLKPDGGQFTLHYGVVDTIFLPYNATALDLVSAIGGTFVAPLDSVTVSGDAGGPWEIEATANGVAGDLTGNPEFLTPGGSAINVVVANQGTVNTKAKFIVSLQRALPVYQDTWTPSLSLTSNIVTKVAGTATRNKSIYVSWDSEIYDGKIWLNVEIAGINASVGPLAYNISSEDFATALITHPSIATASRISVVKDANASGYTVTFIGSLGFLDTNYITEIENDFKGYTYYEGEMAVSTAGTDEVLGSLTTRDDLSFEVEVTIDGQTNTICQRLDTIFRKDLLGNQPAIRTADQTFYTKAEVDALLLPGRVRQFADSAARSAAVPDVAGQLGFQEDTQEYFVAAGTLSAGDWDYGIQFKYGVTGSVVRGATLEAVGTAAQLTLWNTTVNRYTNLLPSPNKSNVTLTLPDLNGQTLGYVNIPQASKSANYTFVLEDEGTGILHPQADNNARTFTIPPNSSVAFKPFTVLMVANEINTVTLAAGVGVTLITTGTGASGNKTLLANGMLTAVKIASDTWFVSGNI